MAYTDLGRMVRERAAQSPAVAAFRVRRGQEYVDVPWSDVLPRLERIGAGVLSALPTLPRGASITIIGNTRLEWVLCDFACLMVGLRTVPVYASLLPEEVGYCHVDTDAILAICEDAAQVEKVRAMRRGFRFFDRDYVAGDVHLQRIVVIDPTGLPPADDWESLEALEKRGAERLDALRAEMDERARAVTRDQIATWTYTSGTTGPPKAVTQTHDNRLAMMEAVDHTRMFNDQVRQGGLFLFLPLAHSFGRLIELAGPFFATPLVLSTIPTLAEDLTLSRPGFFPSAPRVFEKMKAKIDGTVAGASPTRQRLFRWAMGVGHQAIPHLVKNEPLPLFLRLQHAVADRLVLSKLRARLGMDRLAYALTGSAPLGQEVHEFFLSLGVVLLEGYGLTETCPALTATQPGKVRVGTVGLPFSCVTE